MTIRNLALALTAFSFLAACESPEPDDVAAPIQEGDWTLTLRKPATEGPCKGMAIEDLHGAELPVYISTPSSDEIVFDFDEFVARGGRSGDNIYAIGGLSLDVGVADAPTEVGSGEIGDSGDDGVEADDKCSEESPDEVVVEDPDRPTLSPGLTVELDGNVMDRELITGEMWIGIRDAGTTCIITADFEGNFGSSFDKPVVSDAPRPEDDEPQDQDADIDA